MRCSEIENRLPAHREDLLAPGERKSIAAHLAGCPRCSRAMADLEKAEKLLQGLAEVEPPPFFEERIMSRVREEAGRKQGILRRLFYPLHIKIPVQVLATLVVAVLAYNVYQQGDPEMKRMAALPPPLTEQGKDRVETGLSGSPAPSAAATPLRGAPAADPAEPHPQPFAAPPPEKKGSAEMAADPGASGGGENRAASKPAAPLMAAKEKDVPPDGGEGLTDGTQNGARKRDSAKAMEAPPPEQKRMEKAADTGAASGQSGPAISAPSPSRMTAAATSRSAMELTIRVGDPESALRETESRLGRVSARIVERQRRGEGGYLKAEVPVQAVARLLELLEAVGRVNRDADPTAASAGTVTVGITVVRDP
jgi:hypothetical protein